jgi:hypothetical protein
MVLSPIFEVWATMRGSILQTGREGEYFSTFSGTTVTANAERRMRQDFWLNFLDTIPPFPYPQKREE